MKIFKLCPLYQSLFLLSAPMFVFAANPVDLAHQKPSFLNTIIQPAITANKTFLGSEIVETNRAADFNHTVHVRLQQTYLGYRVLGADSVVHIPQADLNTKNLSHLLKSAEAQGSMDGKLYEQLSNDLTTQPSAVFTQNSLDKSIAKSIELFKSKNSIQGEVSNSEATPMIYIDNQNKAHWVLQVKFEVTPSDYSMPAKPVFILDALTFTPYAEWNDIKNLKLNGGGFGGNIKMGQLIYDGIKGDLGKLDITRVASTKDCQLKNSNVEVLNYRDSKFIHFPCASADSKHNNLFWDGDSDKVNGGYSPGNDALYGGMIIKSMYQDWYDLPVLKKDGKPMLLSMVVHANEDNAWWDGERMTFGDGVDVFYPLTSLGVAAHEISHGFTEQHSRLAYYGQSGGMNEAFSDMAAQAAEFFAYGHNSWQIGPEIFKQENQALRYMDQPSKDCEGRTPGRRCSIDNADQYTTDLNVHYSSGVFNRAFYLLGTTKNWNTKKAFDVMVKANIDYWTEYSTFVEGACGVIHAAKDYKYDVDAVKAAFKTVKVDTSSCV